MKKNIVLLPGDGIGPEVVNQAVKVMESINEIFGHEFNMTTELIGAASIDETGSPLTDEVIEKCSKSDAIVLGAIGALKYDNDPSLTVRPEQGLLKLRKSLSLYGNIRPINTYEISKKSSPLKEELIDGVDFVIFRELTGGLYFGDKFKSEDNTMASDNCVYTKIEIDRIAQLAFEMAMTRKKKLLLVDKANVLETSRLWRRLVQEMSAKYPEVIVDYMFVDNAAMQLMMNPKQFDVILTENLFGDILSDLASVITGSLGMLPSSSIGVNTAMFEPIHGSYPNAAGKDIANPFATILSVAMMYDYFNLPWEANCIRNAVEWAMSKKLVTIDLNKDDYLLCSRVGEYICLYIEEEGKVSINLSNLVSTII
tara:strand:+ start:5044 stop:6150 length:1107 start_codon:yes stop_codon:yes gene_type:complete